MDNNICGGYQDALECRLTNIRNVRKVKGISDLFFSHCEKTTTRINCMIFCVI